MLGIRDDLVLSPDSFMFGQQDSGAVGDSDNVDADHDRDDFADSCRHDRVLVGIDVNVVVTRKALLTQRSCLRQIGRQRPHRGLLVFPPIDGTLFECGMDTLVGNSANPVI